MKLASGTRIGPYIIEAFLASGGMGEVYRARDSRLLRSVALKMIPRTYMQDAARLERFEQEARAAGTLSHPHILTVFDVGVYEERPYLVVELLEGELLRNAIEGKQLNVRSAVQYAVQIASGMAAAHERGIIHRDLKPENIFLTRDGLAKILDFGLAKLISSVGENFLFSVATTAPGTSPGTILGTVAYMSPEQARGEDVDARSDIFSFGIVLFEMLLGERPFHGASAAEMVSSILRDEPNTSELRKIVSPELLRVVSQCLAKNTAERYQSARDLTFALRMIDANLFLNNSATFSGKKDTGVASIAVLPFLDMSPQKDQEYFCDGMTEELITALAKLPDLRVASRTSSFQYKNHGADIRQIAAQLNAGAILEGSVRKSGNRIRVSAELIDAANGFHLWSEKYDRNLEDVFAIQDEIAQTIVDTLKIQLVAGHERTIFERYTKNTEAYNLYLKGRHYWRIRTASSLAKAIECFEQAIEKDPQYPLAYAGLADCYSICGFYAFQRPADARPKAIENAEKAMQIDPLLPEAHVAMAAALLYFDLDWVRGEKCMLRALELNPDYALAHCWYSGFLNLAGRPEEGAVEVRKARELDPLSPLYSAFAGFNGYSHRRYDQALQDLQAALEIDSNHLLALWYSGLCYAQKEMYEKAIAFFERTVHLCDRSSFFLAYLAQAHALAGHRETAEALLAEMKSRAVTEYVAPLHFARVYMGMGMPESALDELERAYDERNVLIYLPHTPDCDSLRKHPRFASLLARVLSPRTGE